MKSDEKKTKTELIAELNELRGRTGGTGSVLQSHENDQKFEKIRQVIDGLPQIVYELDLTGRFRYTNDFALKSFGLTRQDIENGLNVTQVIHPDSLANAQKNIRRALKGGASIGEEYLALHKDGTTFHIKVYSHGIIENGQPVGVRGVAVDISDIKQAEEALLKSESYYRTLFENTGTAMVIFGDDSVIRRCNSQYELLSGFSSKEIIGKMKWSDFVDSEDLKRMTEHHKTRLKRKNSAPNNYEFAFLARNGERKQIHIFVQLIPETGDRVCSLIDITSRKRAEQALKKSEEQFRDIVEHASDGIYQCTPDGQFLAANPSMARYLGYDSAEELIDAITDIRNQLWVNPEDRDVYIDALKKHGKLKNYEQHIYRKDGTKIWISENVRKVCNKNGKFIYYEGFLQDVTARKLNENTTYALYAISKAISTTRDLQGLYETIHAILDEVIDATNFFIGILNEKEDRLIFSYFADEKDEYYDIRNVSDPETKSLTVHVIQTGKPLFLSQADELAPEIERHIGVVGTPAAVWLGVPLKVRGKIIGAMAVQHYTNPHHYTDYDVLFMETVAEHVALAIERKTNEEALTLLNEELESKVDKRTMEIKEKAAELEIVNKRLRDLDKIKSSLVSSISHELRTPLTSIRGFAKLTGKDFVRHFQPLAADKKLMKKGERIRQNLEIIETEGERLTRLINDFLDINRIESGKAVWNDRFLNPCDVIRQASNALAGSFAAKPEVKLLTDLPETVPPIHADPDKVQQVLINLLNNACKFTNEGSITVSVTGNLDTLTVTVTDTGIGIPKTEQSYIFDKFHKSRLGDTISTKDKGTGLGLAICKEIVEHYGGSIWVESTPGKGSAFSFTLPVVPGTETACA